MKAPERVGDLEIFQDVAFQRRFWRVQRIGWAIVALLMLAALTGVFGRGPLSHTRVEAGGLVVEYEHLARRESPIELRVRVAGRTVEGDRLSIALDNSLMRDMDLKPIVPAPMEVVAGPEQIVYVFRTASPGSAAEIVFPLKARSWGRVEGRVSLVGRDGVPVRMFLYP